MCSRAAVNRGDVAAEVHDRASTEPRKSVEVALRHAKASLIRRLARQSSTISAPRPEAEAVVTGAE